MSVLAPEDYTSLSPDEVVTAVESTGRLSDLRVMALNSYENRVYQVGLEDSPPVIAKFYRPGRWTDAQIEEEHLFSTELAAAGLPVVAPLAAADGHTLCRHDGFRFALFTRKGGQAPEPGDAEQLYRIGMVLGRVHALGQQRAFVERARLDVSRFLDEPARCVLENADMPSQLRGPYAQVVVELRAAILASGLPHAATVRVHGDCHPGNVLWTRDDGPWLVDFDDAMQAPAVQDLWMLLSGSRPEQELQLADLLEGYTTFHDFDSAELALIEPLRALRMVHYSGWLAARWQDPAFPRHFPWFNTPAYWQEHVQALQQQLLLLQEPPLRRL